MPEHESMQDYIDMIDNEGLLAANKTKNDSSNSKDGSDDEDIPTEEPVKSKTKSSIASSSDQIKSSISKQEVSDTAKSITV